MESMQELRTNDDTQLRKLDDVISGKVNQYIVLVRFINSEWYVQDFYDFKAAENLYNRLKQGNAEVYFLWRLK